MEKRTVLLNPGPVNVTERVRKAQLRGDLCHREEEFSRLLGTVRRKLVEAFGIEKEYTAVLISGSGTAALEMAVCSSVSEGQAMLVIQNGVYGERIAHMAQAHRMPVHLLTYPWGRPPRLEDVESALRKYPEIEVIALVHHETTTGLLNPLPSVSQLARRYRKRLLADCISSLAGEELDWSSCPVDGVVGTANKCIQGLPGVSFVLVRKEDLPRLQKVPARSVYFNLARHHAAQERGDTLFTPAVQAHYALEAALDELIEETVDGRIRRYRAYAEQFRKGFAEMGLELLIPEPELRSQCLTALRLPEGVTYPQVHDRLKKNGFIIYAGQGNLSSQIFRIAHMGDLREEEIRRCLEVLKETCSQPTRPQGVSHDPV